MKKSHWIRSEAVGFNGGIWVLWNEGDVKIEPRYVHKQIIHMAVVSTGGLTWELMVVYASPQASLRRQLWSVLGQLELKEAWALIGDFNCVLRGEERNSGGGVSSSFVEWVEHNGLINLGYSGLAYTWSHGTTMETRRAGRLDRGICDVEWRHKFPSAFVRHLGHAYSDHCPLLLQLRTMDSDRLGKRPFKFQTA